MGNSTGQAVTNVNFTGRAGQAQIFAEHRGQIEEFRDLGIKSNLGIGELRI